MPVPVLQYKHLSMPVIKKGPPHCPQMSYANQSLFLQVPRQLPVSEYMYSRKFCNRTVMGPDSIFFHEFHLDSLGKSWWCTVKARDHALCKEHEKKLRQTFQCLEQPLNFFGIVLNGIHELLLSFIAVGYPVYMYNVLYILGLTPA
jgi:hypothetical protein